MEVLLKENERIDDLQCKGLKIIQNTEKFCFGIDAVLLANFADVRQSDNVVDLGTGTGIIPILLAGKTKAKKIIGVEIQEDIVEMAKRSISLNNLSDRIEILTGDIKVVNQLLKPSSFDAVVTNPPYKPLGSGLINEKYSVTISRHELLCTLEDIIKAASILLKSNGRFSMVHRPSRLADILFLMRIHKIEPKYLRFVHPYVAKRPNLILITGQKCGKPELKMLEPLYIYNDDGTYTDEINKIYGREL